MRQAPDLLADRALQELETAVRDPSVRVLSVDCFDTLLCRRVPKPADVHLLVGKRLSDEELLLPHVSAHGFAQLRRLAEVEARRLKMDAAGTSEVTLREIYAVLGPAVWRTLPEEDPTGIEISVERSILFPDAQLASWLQRVLDSLTMKLILVSDTYFDEDHLRSFLSHRSLHALAFEQIFASSAHGLGKGSGLWDVVVKEMGAPPDAIVHLGDNWDADVVEAESRGIRAFHYPVSSGRFREVDTREGIAGRDDYPSKWCDPVFGDGGITALRRRATLLTPPVEVSDGEQVAWETGTSVFGPVFTGFAQWVVEQSRRLEIDRLVFLMREGRLLQEFTAKAQRPEGRGPSMQTLWISREACARASIFDGSAPELLAFLDRLRPPAPSQLAASFGLDPTAFRGLEALDRRFIGCDDREAAARGFVETVLADSDLISTVVAQSSVRRSRLVSYVREVVGNGSGPVGLVDVGWSGSIQESLQRIFEHEEEPLFFFGLYLLAHVGSSIRALRGIRFDGFLGSLGTDPFDVAAITGGAEIVELVSTCAEGSLLEIGDNSEPILAPPAGSPAEHRSRELVQQGAIAYQKEWLAHRESDVPIFETSAGGRAILTRILKRFVSQPNHDEAEAFRWWLHEENYGSEGTEQLVPPRYVPTIRYRSAEDLHWAPMSDLHWTGGAAALVDHELSDAIFFMREGTVDPGRFSSHETGSASLRVTGSDATEDKLDRPIVRNRHGLSHLEWRISIRALACVELLLADHFVLFRPDVVEFVDAGRDPGVVLFRWERGQSQTYLPIRGARWMTSQVLAVHPLSGILVEFPYPLTTRELRVTVAGAYLPVAEAPDAHISPDPDTVIHRLQDEIDAIYRTKIMRLAAIPRRFYRILRRQDRRGGDDR